MEAVSGEERRGSVAVSAALTSAAQALAMVSGGLLAVLVAIRIGADARTDGFFAAYGAYSVAVLFAQSARTTVVARLAETGDPLEGLNRFLGAGLVVFAFFGLVFVALGYPLASLLTGDLPGEAHDAAFTALVVLWPATGLQLFSALGAVVLGLGGDFGRAAVAFGGGSLTSIAAFLALEPALDVDALPVALLLGSVLTAAVIGAGVVREGWRPSRAILGAARSGGVRSAGVLVASSIAFLLQQLAYLASVGVAARLGEGVVTSYSYAFAAISLLVALPSSASVVLAAPIAQHWDRREDTLLVHHVAVATAAGVVLAPVAAFGWLLGHEIGDVVLRRFAAGEVDLTVDLFLVLLPLVLAAGANAVPLIAVFTLGRLKAAALAAVGGLALHGGLCAAALAADSPELLAAAASVGALVSVPVILAIVSWRYLRIALPAVAAVTFRIAAAAAVAFGGAAAGAHLVDPPARDALAFVAGLALFTLAVRYAMPAERGVAVQLWRSLARR